jgi:allantoinase
MDVSEELRSRGISGPVLGEEPVLKAMPLPGGARVAVTIQLAFEAWSPGISSGSVLGGALSADAAAKGIPDFATLSWQEYGGRTGIWRLLRGLDKCGARASCSTSALCAVVWPRAVAEIAAAGHEIVGHGYSQDQRMESLDESEDLDVVTRSTEILAEVSGQRPIGWSSHGSRRGAFTIASLLKNGYLYTNDFRDADVPYIAASVEGRNLWSLPRTDEINDMFLFRRHGNPPSAYVEYFRRALDQLHSEGETEPKVLTCVAHATLIGRPWGISALAECIEYARSKGDVWVCTRRELAEYAQETHEKQAAEHSAL